MRRYLYNNSKGELYSLDKYIPPAYLYTKEYRNYIGSVNIHNERALEDFVEWVTSLKKCTEEDILKALKVEKYKLISKRLKDFIEAPESGTNITIKNLVHEIIDELGGDSYCCSVWDYFNNCEICDIEDFGNKLFYNIVEKIINVIETFEEER